MADNDKTVGARRRRQAADSDAHPAGKATRSGNDVHATGKAVRNADAHATGKAARRQPYEQDNNSPQNRMAVNASATTDAEWPDFFELDGRKYKNEGVLSDSSGEAVIFTVSAGGKKFALKIYYYDPDRRPNHQVLEKIMQLGGSGLLVNILSHGVWNNPNGEQNDYELMDFCEGGSMEDVVLEGDETRLSQVAVRMASAIDFLARHGILHRDIKPANFFYADKARTQIVLGDFGISVECPRDGYVKIDEMRSPVYAAPEFYTNVPGEPAEVGVESDYFSLGVSLLCLWMGKTELTANESRLLRSKLNETLPVPRSMSPHMVSLIKALTRLKMSERATFDDIKRWAQGDNLGTDSVSAADTDFKVVFNSAKNQIAHSPAELAQFLLADRTLGKKYLYSGRVTRWLEETGRNELAVDVEDIAERIYPKNQNAGLMATVYFLDPSTEYVDPLGAHHTDPKEISTTIFARNEQMLSEITDPESNLMVYLRAHKLDKTIAMVREYLDAQDPIYYTSAHRRFKGITAAYYLAVLLDPQLNFPVWTDNGWEIVETVDQLLKVLHSRAGDRAELTLGYENYILLTSPALVAWLAPRNPALAGRIRLLHDNVSDDTASIWYNSDSAYRIAYELSPEADLFFDTDTGADGRVYTVPQLGQYLNGRLNRMVEGKGSANEFMRDLASFEDTAVADFMRARGKNYLPFVEWAVYCMADDTVEQEKAGPYDLVIAAYKIVAGFLGQAPSYPVGGKLIYSPDELKRFRPEVIRECFTRPGIEQRVRVMPSEGKVTPWLDAWLTVFFQENPKLDLSPKFTYEKEAARYVEFVAGIFPDDFYAGRYNRAIGTIDKAAGKLRKSNSAVSGKRNLLLIAGAVPTLAVLILSWFCDRPDFNPISGHFMATYGIFFVALLIAGWTMLEFGFGFWCGLVGGLAAAAFTWAGYRWFPSVLYFIGGAVLLAGGVAGVIALFKKRDKVDTGGVTIRGNEFEYRQLDALYYAYHQTDDKLDNVVTQYSDIQRSQNRTDKADLNFVGGIWVPVAWAIFLICFFATPGISGSHSWLNLEAKAKSGEWVLGRWVVKYKDGNTRIVCDIDSVADGEKIFGTMQIAGNAPVRAVGTVSSKRDTVPERFEFWPETQDNGHQAVIGNFERRTSTSFYRDRHGNLQIVEIIDSPVGSVKKTADKDTGVTARPVRKRKSKSSEPEARQPAASEAAAEEAHTDNILGEDTMH